jgi:hypothetical protein
MKNPRGILPFICFLGLWMLIAGCATTHTPTAPVESELIGSWRWVKSMGGIAFETRTPETEGYTQSIEFRTDGTYWLYRDGQQLVTYEYILKHEYNQWLNDTADVIHYYYNEEPQSIQAYQMDGDTLSLTSLCDDCFSSVYVRAAE